MSNDTLALCRSLPYPPLTSFIAREREMVQVKRLLTTTRLLTLTGAGGSGKTRLALQVVTDLSHEFEHGVWWVDLATLDDPTLVPQVVASALCLCEESDRSLMDTLRDFLKYKKLLLVLDGCEHLIAACIDLIEKLLHYNPNLRLLTTSRDVLRLAGETVLHLPPLSLPDPFLLLPLQELIQYEALRLFNERAAAVLPSFTPTNENIQSIVQICHRLEGLPLAIELAAARVRMMSVKQIVARLDDCCHFLTHGARTVLPRHQTLRATIDWSYNLLLEQERTLFRRLSVFAGSFTLEAAETICAGEDIEGREILDLLSRLIDKSLVLVEERNGEVQYRMQETIRQYSQNKLQVWEEAEIVHKRYRDWNLGLTAQIGSGPLNTPQKARLDDPEHARLCIADEWSIEKKETEASEPELYIFALGSARIRHNKSLSTPTNWVYTKARELLFYLLCYNGRTKEQIGLAIWPDASPSQLRDCFHSTLHHLRRALGRQEWIIFENDCYIFNRRLAYWFDVETFESLVAQACKLQGKIPMQAIYYLEKAIKLYQGDFLETMLLDCSWYRLRQTELRKIYLDAQLMLGRLFFARKQYDQAINIYHQLIAYDSFLEVAHRELMCCYAQQGEHYQALRHYQTLVKMMHDELSSPPAPETMALFERLRQGESC